jgi:hypothetical protein
MVLYVLLTALLTWGANADVNFRHRPWWNKLARRVCLIVADDPVQWCWFPFGEKNNGYPGPRV